MRKFLQNLQPSSDGKENIARVGWTPQDTTNDNKTIKPEQVFTDVEVKDSQDSLPTSTVNSSLYQKLIINDLTSTSGPSEKYWEVIAERRRKALEDVIEENQKLHATIIALEEENKSCKELLEGTTDLLNTLKEMIDEESCNEDKQGDSGLSTPDSYSSEKHVHKKMKTSNSDACSESDSEY